MFCAKAVYCGQVSVERKWVHSSWLTHELRTLRNGHVLEVLVWMSRGQALELARDNYRKEPS